MQNNLDSCRRVLLIVGLACMAVLVAACAPAESEWHMINVNKGSQGDAHLLIDQGVNVLVDTGLPEPASDSLLPYLQTLGIETIHHLFVSHPHPDHYGGISEILKAGISIENIYVNLPPLGVEDWHYTRENFMFEIDNAVQQGTIFLDISQGFSLKLPNTQIDVLYAEKGLSTPMRKLSVNDYSLIMRWDVGEFRALFTGDLDFTVGTELAVQDFVKADILKVPHHGVTPIAPNSFFEAVAPQLNMFATSHNLWYNARIKQTRRWTAKAAIPFCHNGVNGDVVLRFKVDEIFATSEQPNEDCPNGKLNVYPRSRVKN